MKAKEKITSPEDLNRYLHPTNPITWILLGIIILCLIGLFVWAFTAKISYKISGTVEIVNKEASINIDEKYLNDIKVGQKIYIMEIEGEVLSIDDNKVVISSFDLADGNYDYFLILKTIRPIDFFSK